jgi:Ca-activated chloride channel family protein
MTGREIDLITSGSQAVALRGIRVRSHVSAMGQQTTIEQTFINMEDSAIEATYTFPVPEHAAVCGFEVITGDHVITGAIEESNSADAIYEKAISAGDAAYSLQQVRPDVLCIDVGNIKPRQAALIKVSYVTELDVVDGRVRLSYPTVVAPRYSTVTGTDPLQALEDANALNPPHVLSVPYGLTFEVEVALGRPIRSVESPSHRLHVENKPDGCWIRPAMELCMPDREIVITLDLERDDQPHAEAVIGPDNRTYVAVTFLPELNAGQSQPAEVVFVIDCSGSMEGSSIEQAKAALSLCLRHLSHGDRFNICCFGSCYHWMAGEALQYNQDTLQFALGFAENIQADLGGTEIYPPLSSLLSTSPCVGGSRQVILLTDGQVTNEDACIALARAQRTHNRFFTFGIGPASSQHLVCSLASATGGAAEFITPNERIEEKVLRQFARLASPEMREAMLDWGKTRMEQAPLEIPPILDGDALVLYARTDKDIPSCVTLWSSSGQWTVPVPPAARNGNTVPLLWARNKLEKLEEWNDAPALVSISKEYGLLCSKTTFIGVEHRNPEERNNGRPATRRIPLMIPVGWHGLDTINGIDTYATTSSPCGAELYSAIDIADSCAAPGTPTKDLDDVMALMQSQQADGHFDPPPGKNLNTDWKKAVQAAREWTTTQAPPTHDIEEVISTIAALLLMYGRFSARRALWRRAERKAMTFLLTHLHLQPEVMRGVIMDIQLVM